MVPIFSLVMNSSDRLSLFPSYLKVVSSLMSNLEATCSLCSRKSFALTAFL